MKKYLARLCVLLFFIHFIPVFSFASASAIDSLKTVLSKSKEDTAKVGVLSKLAYATMQEKPVAEHRDILNDQIEKWKGDLEQVDDICVIGMRV